QNHVSTSTRTIAPPRSSLIAPTLPETIASHFETTVSPSSEYQAKAGFAGAPAAATGSAGFAGAAGGPSPGGGCPQVASARGPTAARRSALTRLLATGRCMGPLHAGDDLRGDGRGRAGECTGDLAGRLRRLLRARVGAELAESQAHRREVVRPRRDRERQHSERGLVDGAAAEAVPAPARVEEPRLRRLDRAEPLLEAPLEVGVAPVDATAPRRRQRARDQGSQRRLDAGRGAEDRLDRPPPRLVARRAGARRHRVDGVRRRDDELGLLVAQALEHGLGEARAGRLQVERVAAVARGGERERGPR